uniref:Uncharacterized protein n=1 Tax=Arundo donax TaxID=35708 RepID=A0A0A9FDF7_ARUDO
MLGTSWIKYQKPVFPKYWKSFNRKQSKEALISKTPIRQLAAVSRIGYVSDTDTRWIRHRYVSEKYREKINKRISDTWAIRIGPVIPIRPGPTWWLRDLNRSMRPLDSAPHATAARLLPLR